MILEIFFQAAKFAEGLFVLLGPSFCNVREQSLSNGVAAVSINSAVHWSWKVY